MKTTLITPCTLGVALLAGSFCATASAEGFVEDSKASLMLRNQYFNRDYKDDGSKSQIREWAQAFIAQYSSGYTQGPLGFGLDAQGFLGVKLDSAPGRTGSNLLPIHDDGRAADEFSELGLTGRIRLSQTELRLGTHYPLLPVALAPATRLYPTTFRGGSLRSREIAGLNLEAGKFDRVNLRDSSDNEPMGVAAPNARFDRSARSNDFTYAGGTYQWSPALELRYFHARLEDIYRQDYAGFNHRLPLGPGALRSQFRYFDSREDGQARAGQVDNRNATLNLTYDLGGHSFGVAYQHMTGDTGMPYLMGGDPDGLSEYLYSSDFVNPNEKVWQIRHDYDFAAIGIPGLSSWLRWVHGYDIELPASLGGGNRSETEKQVQLAYVVQSGPARGLAVRVRHSWYSNDFNNTAAFRDDRELRVLIDYKLDLL
ncbi:outer membrane porin, OprD family [Stutzerimonas nosocomialis]|uniref:OprD family porin n=1 Tax=Stutzerimonas nosocomialis TaxID=1056496 RepID=UPI001108F70E|nr:OprD family porin [Stutzerimonas nosocomialis]TLX58546.1 outer membrane porin, OprD family [Stutzerimonas nosocomialis]